MGDRLIEELAQIEMAQHRERVDDWGAGYELGRRYGLGSRCIEAIVTAAKAIGRFPAKSWHNGIKAGSRVREDDRQVTTVVCPEDYEEVST